MYKIYTGYDEYYMSEKNPSDTNIPNELYDKVYILDSEGGIIKFYIDVDILNQLNIDQIWEIRVDIDRDLTLYYDFDMDKAKDPIYNTAEIVNCKLCLNIIDTYLAVKVDSRLETYCD